MKAIAGLLIFLISFGLKAQMLAGADSLQKALKNCQVPVRCAELHNEIAKSYRANDLSVSSSHWNQAYLITKELMEAGAKDSLTLVHYARSLNGLGLVNQSMGSYTRAIDYYQQAGKFFDKVGDLDNYSSTEFNQASLFRSHKQYEEAKAKLRKVIPLRKQTGWIEGLANAFGLMAAIYRSQDSLNLSAEYYDSLSQVSLKENYYYGLGLAADGKASLSEKAGDNRAAISHYQMAADFYEKDENLLAKTASLNNLAEVYIKENRRSSAKKTAEEALSIAQKNHLEERLLKPLRLLAEIAEQEGNYKVALSLQKEYNKVRQRRHTLDKEEAVNASIRNADLQMQMQQDSLGTAQKLKAARKKVKRQRRQKKAFLLLAFGITLAAVYILIQIYRRYRRNIGKEKKAGEALNEKLAFREQDLKMLATEIKVKNEFRNELIQELKAIEKLPSEERNKALRALLLHMQHTQLEESRISPIKERIEDINTEFFGKLKRRYPSLTKTELEICAFVRLNFRNKEIALIRKTTPASVKMARHRIRKKLGIENEEDMQRILAEL